MFLDGAYVVGNLESRPLPRLSTSEHFTWAACRPSSPSRRFASSYLCEGSAFSETADVVAKMRLTRVDSTVTSYSMNAADSQSNTWVQRFQATGMTTTPWSIMLGIAGWIRQRRVGRSHPISELERELGNFAVGLARTLLMAKP